MYKILIRLPGAYFNIQILLQKTKTKQDILDILNNCSTEKEDPKFILSCIPHFESRHYMYMEYFKRAFY